MITGTSLLSPSGSVQQHGLCSSREPCTTKAEEEDTSDVIFTHSDSSLLLSLVIAGRERKAAQIKENLEPACIFPYLCYSLYKKQDFLGNKLIFSLQCIINVIHLNLIPIVMCMYTTFQSDMIRLHVCYLGNSSHPRQISFPVCEMQNPHAQPYMAHAISHTGRQVIWPVKLSYYVGLV